MIVGTIKFRTSYSEIKVRKKKTRNVVRTKIARDSWDILGVISIRNLKRKEGE